MSLKKIKSINRLIDESRGRGVSISYSDDSSISIDSTTLRKNCPCASCLEKRGDTSHHNPLQSKSKPTTRTKSLLKVISATSEEETNLEKIWLIGNYALGLKWQDGHDSGIYTFEYLRSLVESVS